MSLRPGEVFAGYTVERELGAGGMGSVYLAHHPRLPRFDALKLLRAELCDDPSFVGRFEREADTVAQLDHPNIVAVHDRGSQDGQLWISMRFIDGTNAEKALSEEPQGMPPERVVRIVSKVASALDYAHRHQLLHRDVKPANILLTAGPEDDEESERIFLSDFGVAKAIGAAAERISSLTSTGSVVATLDYASPEQIKGQVLDARSDIYALGCVLYKLLTGTVPFPGDNVAARVYGHLNNAAPPPSSLVPDLPGGFDEVVAKAMAKDADDRYPTCRALAVAARAALTSGPAIPAEPTVDPDEGFPTTVNPVTQPPPNGNRGAATGEHPRPLVQPLPPWLGPAQGGTLPQSFPSNPTPSWPGPSTAPEQVEPTWNREPAPQPAEPAQTGPPGPPPQHAAGTGSAQSGDGNKRRNTMIGAGAGVLLVAAAIGTFLVLKGNVAGTATLGAGTSISSPATTASTSSSAVVSSSAPVSSSAGPTTPVPVPGLPQSTPLPEEVLLGSRVVDGSTNLYQMNGDTGSLGTALTTGAPGVQFPILSPDRGSVVYVQNTPTGNTLRTVAVDGTGDRLLFDTWPAGCTNIYRPAWNPVEQTQLALTCVTAAGNTEVHIISVDGTDLGIIDTGFPVVDDLTYSPDGKTLAFWGSEAQGSEGSIYTKPLDGSSQAKRVTKAVDGTADADPSWSPDGSKIAFRRFVGDGSSPDSSAQLYVINADGTGLTQITEGPSIDQDPIWSPDGTQIAFKSNRQDAQGKEENQIWVIAAEGGELKEIGAGSPGTADGAPAWGHR